MTEAGAGLAGRATARMRRRGRDLELLPGEAAARPLLLVGLWAALVPRCAGGLGALLNVSFQRGETPRSRAGGSLLLSLPCTRLTCGGVRAGYLKVEDPVYSHTLGGFLCQFSQAAHKEI